MAVARHVPASAALAGSVKPAAAASHRVPPSQRTPAAKGSRIATAAISTSGSCADRGWPARAVLMAATTYAPARWQRSPPTQAPTQRPPAVPGSAGSADMPTAATRRARQRPGLDWSAAVVRLPPSGQHGRAAGRTATALPVRAPPARPPIAALFAPKRPFGEANAPLVRCRPVSKGAGSQKASRLLNDRTPWREAADRRNCRCRRGPSIRGRLISVGT